MTDKKITIVCPKCGSEDVVRNADARWDVEAQDWSLAVVFDQKFFLFLLSCNQCEYEGYSFGEKTINENSDNKFFPA